MRDQYASTHPCARMHSRRPDNSAGLMQAGRSPDRTLSPESAAHPTEFYYSFLETSVILLAAKSKFLDFDRK
ncbi:hypothetical protein CDAR_538281 [Caerostris darwini]|uniref:Uncharacterized protein n=1 Tax=Caerostris darwini TaxID=1538125 RepID=A0AAV4UCP7_9ARAC|nr:hypothetical protein CDAR_538281 [Caerostris darwini]